jgi:hypothetical protein
LHFIGKINGNGLSPSPMAPQQQHDHGKSNNPKTAHLVFSLCVFSMGPKFQKKVKSVPFDGCK